MIFKILLLLAAVVQVWCQCFITEKLVKDKHTLAIQEANNRPMKLLNASFVENGSTLKLFCGKNTITAICAGRQFQPSLDRIPQCNVYAKPELILVGKDPRFKCLIYDVSLPYYVTKTQKGYLPVYSACYNTNEKTPVYTNHWVYTAAARSPRPNAVFEAVPPAPADSNLRLTPRKVYEAFKKLYGNGQSYCQADVRLINRGHLVPSLALTYTSQKVATFNFINVVPQMKDINSGNWQVIEQFVVNHLASPQGTKVTTGAFGVLKLQNEAGEWVPLYLKEGKQLPVPMWTYKKIEGHNVVYLVYNSLINIAQLPKPKCGAIPCRELNLAPGHTKGMTFCCNAQTFDHWLRNEMKKFK